MGMDIHMAIPIWVMEQKKMKITKEQAEVIKKYAKENGITIEQAINYAINILEQEMEN